MKNSKIIITLIVGIAFVLGLGLLGAGVKGMRIQKQQISVTGMAERNFKSDQIVWTAQYQVQMQDLQAAYTALHEKQNIVAEYLKSKNLPDSVLKYSSISMDKTYESSYNSHTGERINRFSGYQLQQSVTVSSSDVEGVEAVSRDITELINKGVEINSLHPRYYYTKLNDLKIDMLEEASADALNRAEVIAKGSKASLGKMSNSAMGVFQIVGLNSDEDYSWGGSFNTTSKFKTASITVKASYKIK